ncbi:MAG: hypothetical protein R6U84_04645 [Candidatus Cloacimonadales bacterium]
MKKISVIVILILAAGLVAQNPTFRPDFLIDQFNGFDKLQMNHSVSFSSGVSSNSQSFYMSTYTNHLQYDLGPKLDLNLDLNFVNFGTATHKRGLSFDGNNDNMSLVVPEFQLNYRPTENSEIRFMFRTVQPFTDNRDDFLKW